MRRVVQWCAVLLPLLAQLGRAEAQVDDEHARVIDVLRHANDLARGGAHAEAISLLQRAQSDLDDPRLELAVAESEIALGRVARARRRLAALRRAGNPLVAEAARQRLDEVEERFARVVVHVASHPGSLRLEVDGGSSYEAVLDSRLVLLLEPGVHHVRVHGPEGALRTESELRVEAGEQRVLELRPAGAANEGPALLGSSPVGLDLLSWILGGSIGVVVGAAFTALAYALASP